MTIADLQLNSMGMLHACCKQTVPAGSWCMALAMQCTVLYVQADVNIVAVTSMCKVLAQEDVQTAFLLCYC